MRTKAQDIQSVKSLGHGDSCYIFWSEESGGEVYRILDTLFLFEISQYGCAARFHQVFRLDEVEELVDLAYTWT